MAEVAGTEERPKPQISAPTPLTAEHDATTFDCGSPQLNAWLRERALKNEGRTSRTYVACDGQRVAAFFCISAGSVERAAAPGKMRRNAPDVIPVSLIGRLAVCKDYGGCGLGADMLADALRRIAVASQSIGIGAVLVHAKDDDAKMFYLKQAEFIEYPEDSRTLFLPIETVIAAFS